MGLKGTCNFYCIITSRSKTLSRSRLKEDLLIVNLQCMLKRMYPKLEVSFNKNGDKNVGCVFNLFILYGLTLL